MRAVATRTRALPGPRSRLVACGEVDAVRLVQLRPRERVSPSGCSFAEHGDRALSAGIQVRERRRWGAARTETSSRSVRTQRLIRAPAQLVLPTAVKKVVSTESEELRRGDRPAPRRLGPVVVRRQDLAGSGTRSTRTKSTHSTWPATAHLTPSAIH